MTFAFIQGPAKYVFGSFDNQPVIHFSFIVILVDLTHHDTEGITWIMSPNTLHNIASATVNERDTIYIIRPYQALAKDVNGVYADQLLTTLHLGYKAYENVLSTLCLTDDTTSCLQNSKQLKTEMVRAMQKVEVDFDQLKIDGFLPTFYDMKKGTATFSDQIMVANPPQPRFSLYNNMGEVRLMQSTGKTSC